MKCPLCRKKKAKRFCPAKGSSICSGCCGEKRGVEIDCPQDCPHLLSGLQYQQERITKLRVKSEGTQSYIRKAKLYRKSPRLFYEIESLLADIYRGNKETANKDIVDALELTLKSLKTADSGLIYEHTSTSGFHNEIAKSLLDTLWRFRDGAASEGVRLTIDYLSDVVKEFQDEIRFFIELDANSSSYLIHVSRYHPVAKKAEEPEGQLIIT